MTLGGLALAIGILVDQSIVVLDNITRHLDMGKTSVQAALDGTQEVAMPVLVSTITFVVVFFPVVFLTGIARDSRRLGCRGRGHRRIGDMGFQAGAQPAGRSAGLTDERRSLGRPVDETHGLALRQGLRLDLVGELGEQRRDLVPGQRFLGDRTHVVRPELHGGPLALDEGQFLTSPVDQGLQQWIQLCHAVPPPALASTPRPRARRHSEYGPRPEGIQAGRLRRFLRGRAGGRTMPGIESAHRGRSRSVR